MCMRVTYAVMLMIVMMRLSRIGSMGIYDRMTLVCWRFEMLLQPCENGVQPCTIHEVGEDERTFAAHTPRVKLNHFHQSSHVGCQVNFVNDLKTGARDARATFNPNFID